MCSSKSALKKFNCKINSSEVFSLLNASFLRLSFKSHVYDPFVTAIHVILMLQ